MTKKPARPEASNELVEGLLRTVEPALLAKDAKQFVQAIKEGFDGLYDALVTGQSRKQVLLALDEAFKQTAFAPRQRRVLELCTWPIFDKPSLPSEDEGLPEFLWLFCLPFIVQFSEKDLGTPKSLPEGAVDGQAILELLEQTEWVNPKAYLSAFPTLLSRDDLHRYGPKTMAGLFVSAEMGDENAGVEPKDLEFDAEVESARVTTLYLTCAARLPVGEQRLFQTGSTWDGSGFEKQLLKSLKATGWNVDELRSLPPCSMAEALFKCAGPGAVELGRVLDLAKEHYSPQEVLVRHPAEGVVELTATCDGDEIALTNPFLFFEPKFEMQALVKRLCEERGLAFRGAFSAVLPSGPMFH